MGGATTSSVMRRSCTLSKLQGKISACGRTKEAHAAESSDHAETASASSVHVDMAIHATGIILHAAMAIDEPYRSTFMSRLHYIQ